MQKRTRLGECYFDLKGKTRMKDGKRREQMKERNVEKKSKIVNCQIGIVLSCGLPLLNN